MTHCIIRLDELVGTRFRRVAARSHVMKQNALTNTCAKSTEGRILRSTFSRTSLSACVGSRDYERSAT